MATQKEIARLLDRAASNSVYPATSKQCWFLAGLMSRMEVGQREANDYVLYSGLALSKNLASKMIGSYQLLAV